jgi:hypothetical protein
MPINISVTRRRSIGRLPPSVIRCTLQSTELRHIEPFEIRVAAARQESTPHQLRRQMLIAQRSNRTRDLSQMHQ